MKIKKRSAGTSRAPKIEIMMAFDRLDAGRACYRLTVAVYRATERFPKREWYGLASQARRAALSAPLNLAEGAAKRGACEFRWFVDIAFGSLAELRIALRLSRDLDLLSDDDWRALAAMADDACQLTWGLARSLDRHKPG